ncbi:hypothetical protein [Micromonospora vulcania]|uniref:Uncharacterized protein n=1 Tax=Micromonospora vulcania TaxID=1441873 RepID=A0ABW1GYX4_9ACTN
MTESFFVTEGYAAGATTHASRFDMAASWVATLFTLPTINMAAPTRWRLR